MKENEKLAISSKALCEYVVEGMQEKKATDITILDLTNIKHAIADYFVICSGNSDTQIDAIADSIEDEVRKKCKQKPWKQEGKNNKEWILVDYVDVVAHVFSKEKRQFFGLEELWGDAQITKIED